MSAAITSLLPGALLKTLSHRPALIPDRYPANTRHRPNVVRCWASVADGDPTLHQHWSMSRVFWACGSKLVSFLLMCSDIAEKYVFTAIPLRLSVHFELTPTMRLEQPSPVAHSALSTITIRWQLWSQCFSYCVHCFMSLFFSLF